MARPEDALHELADRLRAEGTAISAFVRPPAELRTSAPEPALGLLVAAGPRAAGSPAGYAHVVEAIREGYLLHYGRPRLLAGADRDLALLAGDYLYALGLERLAGLGDVEAVRELADLISLQAQLHDDGPPSLPEAAESLWLAAVVAVAAGAGDAHRAATAKLRSGSRDAARELALVAADTASRHGLSGPLGRAADSIDFALGGSP